MFAFLTRAEFGGTNDHMPKTPFGIALLKRMGECHP
jgi:hypothetical protein